MEENKKLKVVTVSFDYAGNEGKYQLLQDVFSFTLAEHGNPSLHVRKDPPLDMYKAHRFQTSNNYKLGVWIDVMNELQEDVAFCDVDMLCNGPIDTVWSEEFDLAYTRRTAGQVPINAGVMFVRYTPRSIKFLEKWRKIDNAMRLKPELRKPYADRYCGQNQASFGFMLERHSDMARCVPVPCRTWNVCDEDWKDFPDDARLIHYKSRLRDAILSHTSIDMWSEQLHKAMITWYAAERRMLDAQKA